MYMPTYADALELKRYLKERDLQYVHFHDQCGSTFSALTNHMRLP